MEQNHSDNSVLVVNFKNYMSERYGYLTLSDIEDLDIITFDKCIKIKADFIPEGTRRIVFFWEGFDYVVLCDAQFKKLVNGFLQVTLLTKTFKNVSDVAKNIKIKGNKKICYYCFEKIFLSKNDVVSYIDKQNSLNESVNQSQVYHPKDKQMKSSKAQPLKNTPELDNLVEKLSNAWGIKKHK